MKSGGKSRYRLLASKCISEEECNKKDGAYYYKDVSNNLSHDPVVSLFSDYLSVLPCLWLYRGRRNSPHDALPSGG